MADAIGTANGVDLNGASEQELAASEQELEKIGGPARSDRAAGGRKIVRQLRGFEEAGRLQR